MYEIVLTGPSNPWAHRPERSRGNFSPPAYWWEAVDNNWFVILFNVCLSGMNVTRVATLDTRHSLATTTVFWIRTGGLLLRVYHRLSYSSRYYLQSSLLVNTTAGTRKERAETTKALVQIVVQNKEMVIFLYGRGKYEGERQRKKEGKTGPENTRHNMRRG
ncbi:hypothetical protein CPB85DRAFT_1254001 [Mucidula mucida]|nr:hypothetical protein CPB85DRAFT_1254001 [Mucidula mucida]